MKKIFTLLSTLALAASFCSSVSAADRTSMSSGLTSTESSYSETKECVLANSTDTYSATFKKGMEVTVLVSGDGDTDLDLYIYDENNNLIDSDTDTSDTMLCSWTPKWTGKFTIKIKNLGSVRNYYTMWIE